MSSSTPIDIRQVCRWAIRPCPAILVSLVMVATTALFPAVAFAQAVYGSIGGTVKDPSGAVLPGVTVTITSVERQTADTVRDQRVRQLREGAAAARHVRSEGGAGRLQDGGRALADRGCGRADTGRLHAGGRRGGRAGHGHRRIAAAEGGPRRRLDPFRHQTAHRASGARSQLHQVHPAHAGHAAAPGGSMPRAKTRRGRRRRWSTASTSAAPAYQLDGTENRDPILGIIVINPTLESIGETKITSQNYDAEFGQATAGVGVGSDQVGHERPARQRVRVLPERTSCRRATRLPSSSLIRSTGRFSRTPNATSSAPPSAGRSNGTSVLLRRLRGHPQHPEARRLLTVPTAAARSGDLSAYGVNIYDPVTRLRSSPGTASRRGGYRSRRRTC